MNKLVIFSLILSVVQAADKPTDVKAKTTSSPVNTIQQNTKYEMFYQPVKYQQPVQLQLQPMQHFQTLHQLAQLQPKPQYVPIQVVPKQFYVHSPQPHAMIIIAQPALLPQSLLYGSATQQLLNYFHNNPQAKYQLLHGNYQQPQTQQIQSQSVQPTATYMHPVIASPIGNYILTSAPQLTTQLATQPQLTTQPQLVSHATPTLQYTTQQTQLPVQQLHQLQHVQPVQPQQQQQQQHQQQKLQQVQQPQQTQQPQQQQFASLAQLAQIAANQYVNTQMKTTPAIVTGFEHFTPEQQAQIKAQLSKHLGSNFHAVSNTNSNQYSAKYVAPQENVNFVPSPQVKNEAATTVTSPTIGDLFKNRYMKKN